MVENVVSPTCLRGSLLAPLHHCDSGIFMASFVSCPYATSGLFLLYLMAELVYDLLVVGLGGAFLQNPKLT